MCSSSRPTGMSMLERQNTPSAGGAGGPDDGCVASVPVIKVVTPSPQCGVHSMAGVPPESTVKRRTTPAGGGASSARTPASQAARADSGTFER